jgi:regulator of sirC expression with transglutaminase-like and TPR domain
VVYVEVARRAGIPLAGVGLPGHFVVGHFGADPPLLFDPFAGGGAVEADVAQVLVRPWRAPEIAMRMLNNLVAAYQRRGDLGAAMRAASMRLALPAEGSLRDALQGTASHTSATQLTTHPPGTSSVALSLVARSRSARLRSR